MESQVKQNWLITDYKAQALKAQAYLTIDIKGQKDYRQKLGDLD